MTCNLTSENGAVRVSELSLDSRVGVWSWLYGPYNEIKLWN